MSKTLALRLAELALRVVPPLLRAAKRHDDARDIEARRAALRREIERQIGDRSKARIIRGIKD